MYWCNGVLASTAVGVLTRLITGWTKSSSRRTYLSYNGNANTVKSHTREEFPLHSSCDHFDLNDGDL